MHRRFPDWLFLRELVRKLLFHLILLAVILLFVGAVEILHRVLGR